MKQILVSGSLAYDAIKGAPEKQFGGTAGNIAYALGLLGERPLVIGSLGHDFAAYHERLMKVGANVDFVKIFVDTPTAYLEVSTDEQEQQQFTMYPGAMEYASAPDAETLPTDAWAIVSPGNLEDMLGLPELYRARKQKYFFDPGQQIPQLSSHQLKAGIAGSYALISNEYELEAIMAKTGWSEADILANVEVLITTHGAQGSRIHSGGVTTHIPVVAAREVKDPTGAGDAYRAGLLKGLNAGWSLETAAKFASIMGVYAVESLGAQGHQVTFAQAQERYKKTFNENL